MHPSIDGKSLPGWDLAWDYTPGPDLTFLVFFWCKHSRRPTCRALTPLLKKERADPMLSDPNLPRLPLSHCHLSLFPVDSHFNGHLPLTHPPLLMAWEPTPVALPRPHRYLLLCLHKNGLLWRPSWPYLDSIKGRGLGPFCDAKMAL